MNYVIGNIYKCLAPTNNRWDNKNVKLVCIDGDTLNLIKAEDSEFGTTSIHSTSVKIVPISITYSKLLNL